MPTIVAGASKMSFAKRIAVGMGSVLIFAVSIGQIRHGVSELFGGTKPEVVRRLAASDTTGMAANAGVAATNPLLNAFLSSVDSIGLANVRRDRKGVALDLSARLDSTEHQFRRAASQCDSASRIESRAAMKRYLDLRVEGYTRLADVTVINATIVGMVIGDSIATTEALVAWIRDARKQREAAMVSAASAFSQATVVSKQLHN
jgi:hypothetical protein